MAVQMTGRGKKAKKPTTDGNQNGHLNGSTNGHAKKMHLSSSATRSKESRRPRRTVMGALTSLVARLVTWYLIITTAFRCPSSLTQIDASSPRVCTPYLQARSYAAPYLDPYYQTYVAPQVDKIKPYADRYYTPAAAFTKDKYATYGAHRVEHARKLAEANWDKTARPQLQNALNKVKAQYDLHLGHHVQEASKVAAPYYDQTKASANEIYYHSIVPAYEASLPYLRKGYAHGNHAVVNIIFPYVRSAKDTTWAFILRTVWPQLRILYGDNVEPQLVRISERLGRYRDQQKVESAVVDAVDSQTASKFTKAVPTIAGSAAVSASSSSDTKSGWGVLDEYFGGNAASTASGQAQAETATHPAEPKLTGAELKAKLNDDLEKWQTKFAAAADKGSEDLEHRVAEITKRQIDNGVKGHGRALVVKLEETADATVAKLKRYIKQTVKAIPEDATEQDLEEAYEHCDSKTRELGLAIKEKAQDVRAWKASYDQETDSLVQAAVKSTVEVLDKIHGLGLQEVGMRWAWTDGVTYKDWQKYHKLRETLTEWQAEVESVGSKHEGLRVAHEEAKNLEDEAMAIASKMVNELIRLKNVSKWKIWAGDASDDFSTQKVPVRVFNAAQQVIENVGKASVRASEAIVGSETPVSESVASSIQSAFSDASAKVSSQASAVSEVVLGHETPATESLASSVKGALSDASSKVSEAVVGSETPVVESVLSQASSSASEVVEKVESAAQRAKEAVDEKIDAATASPKKVWGGVNAQVFAEAREVIFDEPLDDGDDDETYSAKLQSMVADAGDRAAELSKVVSEALLGPSKTQGTVESATSLASEQYAKAIAAASSILYGTEKHPVESATSVASEKFAQAVTAASYAIYGTPTPTAIFQTVQIGASSRYNEAVRLASERLENAKSQLSQIVSGTPKPAHETMLSMFERAYSDSVAAASDRLQAALQYTDSVKSYAAGPTQGYFESVSSIASSRLSEGLSQASAQFSSKPTPALDSARRQYYEAVGLAHARYSEFMDAASSGIYGPSQGTVESLASVASASAASAASVASANAAAAASGVSESAQAVVSNVQAGAESLASQVSSGVIGSETPWTESVASQASENWESLIAKASSQVYGQPTPWAESIYSQAGEYGAQATEKAAQQYANVQALISELVVGKEPDFTESVMSRFASAYYTGVPAAVSSVQSYASEHLESASSLAGESFESVTEAAADAYSSASSVVSSIFTPPAAIETILSQASASIDSALESASVAVYGTPKGAAEQASESVASAYASIQSQVSQYMYGTQQAQDSFSAAAISAQAAISAAIFGTPTPTAYAASVTSGVGSVYSSVASAASENAENAYSAISSAVYGPEQGAMESASSRIAAAVEAANSRISEMYASGSKTLEEAASSVASVGTEATQRVKDEL